MVHDELTRHFLSAQLAGDRQGAVRLVLDAVRAGVSSQELLVRVIAAAQREIGRLWELNQVSIAQEHLATAIAQLALAQLYGHADRATATGWTVVLACVEGEQHDFGPRIAADILETAGYDVRFLGADVPTDTLVDFARSVDPDVICLSATMPFHLPALRAVVSRLREVVPAARVLAGGGAIGEVGAPEGATAAGASAEDLVQAISGLRQAAA